MCLVKSFQSFRCCNDAHELNIPASLFLNKINSSLARTACCKHRVNDYCNTLINGFWKFAVVLMRLMSYRISVKSYMADFCRRNQSCYTIYHSKTCTKDRYDRQFFTGDHRTFACLDWSLDLHILGWQIAKCLISHQDTDLLYQFTELVCSCIFITEH